MEKKDLLMKNVNDKMRCLEQDVDQYDSLITLSPLLLSSGFQRQYVLVEDQPRLSKQTFPRKTRKKGRASKVGMKHSVPPKR